MPRTRLFTRQKLTLQGWLYRISLVFFLIVFIGLLVATPIDIVHQSKTSGQFWDAIIVVIAYVLAVVIAIFLFLIRLIQVKTSLSDIPRRYVTRKDDVSERCASRIRNELARCADIVQQTLPRSENISHPGLRNPDLSEGSIDTPYEEIAAACSAIIEVKAKSLHPTFVRPRGMPLREYLILLESYDLLDWSDYVDTFLILYEKARFSEKPMAEDDFNDYIECTFQVLYSIKVPEGSEVLVSVGGYSSKTPSYSQQPQNARLFVQQLNQQLLSSQSRLNQHPQSTSQFLNPYTTRSYAVSPLQSPRQSVPHSQLLPAQHSRGSSYLNTTTNTGTNAENSPVITPWDFNVVQYTGQPASRINSRDNSSPAASPFFTGHSYSNHNSRYNSSGIYPLHSLSLMSTRPLSPTRTRQSQESQESDAGSVIIHRLE